MTETQAYNILGWPRGGVPMGFVLPISGSERTDWVVFECPNVGNCGYRGLGVPESFETPPWKTGEMATCPQCKMAWRMTSESWMAP